jgi:hypothetical protein
LAKKLLGDGLFWYKCFVNDGNGLSEKGLADLPCVKGVLKTWDIWKEACVEVNHSVLQKVQQVLDIGLTYSSQFCNDVIYVTW